MRIYQGSYGKDTTEDNSLVKNLLLYPEISRVLIRQMRQYTLTYLTEGTARYAKEKIIGNNKFVWKVQGRLNQPTTCTGNNSGNGAGHGTFTVETEENFLNPYDVVRFKDGSNAVVIGEATGSGPFTYNFKLQNKDDAATINTASVAASGDIINTLGSAFPEASDRGYMNVAFPGEYVNYTTIFRKSTSISGSAFSDVTWIENNGHRVWFFTQEQQMMEEFMYQVERAFWYGQSTVADDGAAKVFDNLGKPLIAGDGVLNQIDPSNKANYVNLTEDVIVDFMSQLSMNSNAAEGNHWMVFTGTAGRKRFHKAMKDLIVQGGSVIYDMGKDRYIEMGQNYATYNALSNKITLVQCSLFDDRNANSDLDSDGIPKESSRLAFLDFGVTDGISNVETFVKGAEGYNRGLTRKYVVGMASPFDQNGMISSNAKDGFTAEVLCEKGIVIRNPLSCGQLLMV